MNIPDIKLIPCEDAVSKQGVAKILLKYVHNAEGKAFAEFLIGQINDLPSVNPKQSWIPVSERLPEIHQDVLLSFRSLDVEVGFRGNTEPYYYCHGDYIEQQNVLAWQPLPEPYKAEGSDKE